MPYQYVWHQVKQMNATWVGGIATAKTSTTAASNTMDCLAYPYFKRSEHQRHRQAGRAALQYVHDLAGGQ